MGAALDHTSVWLPVYTEHEHASPASGSAAAVSLSLASQFVQDSVPDGHAESAVRAEREIERERERERKCVLVGSERGRGREGVSVFVIESRRLSELGCLAPVAAKKSWSMRASTLHPTWICPSAQPQPPRHGSTQYNHHAAPYSSHTSSFYSLLDLSRRNLSPLGAMHPGCGSASSSEHQADGWSWLTLTDVRGEDLCLLVGQLVVLVAL